jgi:hypothetical protein
MPEEILLKKQNEQFFWYHWEKMAAENQASSCYLKLTQKYLISISRGRGLFVDDKSFIYLVNGIPAAAVFLPIEKNRGNFNISILGGYINAPIFSKDAKRAGIFSIIDQVAVKEGVGKAMFEIDSLDEKCSYNYLQRYGYFDTSILAYLIDLTVSENLFRSCRKGHRCDIKKILNNKDFEVFFVNKGNPSYTLHEEYCKLHHKCSGRITRSKESFDLQFEKLKQGNAVLVGLKYKQKNICFSYFEFAFDKAIYISGADDPDFDKIPLYHVLIFSAMEYLKKKGICCIDPGQPASPSAQFNYYPDKKQLNIALFKRGFGGKYVQNFRGIKYFSKLVFRQDAEEFIKKYEDSLEK